MEGRMLGKTATGQKRLQMLSNITSKDYVTLKREVQKTETAGRRVCHKPAVIPQKTKETTHSK